MKFVDEAIDGYVMHELLAVRRAEQRLANQLARTERDLDRRAIVRAMTFLEERLDSLDTVLTELNKSNSRPAGARSMAAGQTSPPLLAA